MSEDLRCHFKLHGIIVEPGVMEVKCDSKFCGAGNGAVILHRFDLSSGELLGTKRYKKPGTNKEDDSAARNSTSLRSA